MFVNVTSTGQPKCIYKVLWNVYIFLSNSIFFSGEPHLSSGGPAYKPKEDYYDEIIELKKVSFVTFSIRKIKHLLQKGLCSFDIMWKMTIKVFLTLAFI